MVAANPCRKFKKLMMDNMRSRYLSVEEEERLMEALTERLTHLRPIILAEDDEHPKDFAEYMFQNGAFPEAERASH